MSSINGTFRCHNRSIWMHGGANAYNGWTLLTTEVLTAANLEIVRRWVLHYYGMPPHVFTDATCHIIRESCNSTEAEVLTSKHGLIAYLDLDHAGDTIHRCSVTGYIVKLANTTIAEDDTTSSTEAEYMALLKHLFAELGIPIGTIPICTDNNGAIFIGSNLIQERCVKHMDVRYHYIRERVENGDVEILHVDSADNPANMFTKPLGHIKFGQFRNMLGLEFYS
ncbi:hypothetical protein NMY22_g6090 [Coprinellus aureogranulatus]|nr:hypothetical protein NMY22_g6090 [Coprinellus aureogranulatus]